MITDPLAPVHPGEILREEFLEPLGITPYALAAACRVPRTRFERLAAERARVSPDTALRLARYFGTTPGFWLAIQAHYDIEIARRLTGKDIETIRPRACA